MTEDGVREFTSKTLYLNPVTGTPYPELNQFTYDYLDPEIQSLYRWKPSLERFIYHGSVSK